MRIVTLDVHAELCQLMAVAEHGEVIIELRVETRPEELRRVIGGIPGPKRVVFEEGPLSGVKSAPRWSRRGRSGTSAAEFT